MESFCTHRIIFEIGGIHFRINFKVNILDLDWTQKKNTPVNAILFKPHARKIEKVSSKYEKWSFMYSCQIKDNTDKPITGWLESVPKDLSKRPDVQNGHFKVTVPSVLQTWLDSKKWCPDKECTTKKKAFPNVLIPFESHHSKLDRRHV